MFFDSLIENHESAMTELVNIAEEVRQLFLSMTEEVEEHILPEEATEDTSESRDFDASVETQKEKMRRLRPEKLEKKFRELQATPEFQSLLESAEQQGNLLRQFRHKISLAFQNTRDGELNMLFTGDVQPQYMKLIVEDYDGKIPLHEHYWCIKVPHHGTESHFFDFSRFSPENMMIPNGAYYDNSKKKSKNQRTSMQYGGLFYISDAHMYCSNCDCCDSYENGCSCREYDVISPSYYKDI